MDSNKSMSEEDVNTENDKDPEPKKTKIKM